MAIIRHEQNRVLISEAAIRAAPLLRTGRTYVEFQQSVNTGIALVNSNPHWVAIDFYFTDDNGMKLHSGSLTLGPNANTMGFLNAAPFAPPARFDLRRARTFTFSASAPIAFTAVRGFTNERSEFIMTPLQVSAGEPAVATAPTVIPYYADGGPWKARIILTNPSNHPLSGALEIFTSRDGESVKRVNYEIPSASAITVPLSDPEPDTRAGWIRITPNEGTVHPSAIALLSFRSNDSRDYEFGVTAVPEESAFRIYTETSGVKPDAGAVQSSVVLTNSASTPAVIHLEALQMDGAQTGLYRNFQIPPRGQIVISDEIAELLNAKSPFKGFLRFSGAPTTAVGLKSSYNERGHLLVTAMPPIPESLIASGAEKFFLFSADLLGYITRQFVFDPR